MVKTLVALPNGTELFSGPDAQDAVVSCTVTESVNRGENLTLGSVCAAMAEVSILTETDLIHQGDSIVLYRVDEQAQREKIGMFLCQKPEKKGRRLRVTAYDRVVLLDREMGPWVQGLTGWPYRLLDFTRMVLRECGLELENRTIPNGDFLVQKFAAQQVSGRTLIRWAAEAAGRFCHATAEGKIRFDWYMPAADTICPTDRDSGKLQIPYYMGSFRYEDYEVTPVERVCIRMDEKDVGTVFPDVSGKKNTYLITGNRLLTALDGKTLLPVAEAIYNQLRDFTYVPCRITIPDGSGIRAGHMTEIQDPDGRVFKTLVMDRKLQGAKVQLESRGHRFRENTDSINNETVDALTGKYMHLAADVDGLSLQVGQVNGSISDLQVRAGKIESRVADAEGSVSALTQTVGGLDGTISSLSGDMTALSATVSGLSSKVTSAEGNASTALQTANSVSAKVSGKAEKYAGNYNFSYSLDESGFSVKSSGSTVLNANSSGVTVNGEIKATSGLIGSTWHIEDWGIWAGEPGSTAYYGQKTVLQSPQSGSEWMFAAGGVYLTNLNTFPFRVAKDGNTVIEFGTLGRLHEGWVIHNGNTLWQTTNRGNNVFLEPSGIRCGGAFASWENIVAMAQ